MKNKSISLIFVFMLMSFSVSTVNAQELTGTLEKIRNSGVITIGHRVDSVPFAYQNALHEPIGYAKDLCDAVVESIKTTFGMPGLKIRYYPVTSLDRITLLQDGKIDMECGATINTRARQDLVSFSVTYFISDIRMVARKDSGIRKFSDLYGKNIVTTAGSIADELLKKRQEIESEKINVLYGKDHSASFLKVKSGSAVAFVMDNMILASLVANSKDPNAYSLVDLSFGAEHYAVMIRKNDTMFKEVVDKILSRLMITGAAEKIYSRWFMSPIPPHDINLKLPMSDAMKQAFANPTDKVPEY